MNKKEITAESELSISIENTKKSLEKSFETGNFYNKQTQDQTHLEKILHRVKISDGIF